MLACVLDTTLLELTWNSFVSMHWLHLSLCPSAPNLFPQVCTTMLDLVLSCLDGLVLTEGGDNKPHPLLRVAAVSVIRMRVMCCHITAPHVCTQICLEGCPSAAIAVCQGTGVCRGELSTQLSLPPVVDEYVSDLPCRHTPCP